MRLTSLIIASLRVSSLALLVAHAHAEPDNHIPALLQFAQQYQEREVPAGKHSETRPGRTENSTTSPAKPAVPPAGKLPSARPGAWKMKDTELIQQRATIADLKTNIAALQEKIKQFEAVQADKKSAPVDLTALSLFAKNIRHALGRTADETEAVNRIKQASQEKTVLLQRAKKLGEQMTLLQAQNSQLKLQLTDIKSQSLRESEQQKSALQAEHAKQIAGLQAALETSRSKQLAEITPESLNSEKSKQDYAAGISLGEEILQMQAERQRWGVETDKQLILSGIVDTFAGKRRLSEEVLNTALSEAENEVIKARAATITRENKSGTDYLQHFKTLKNAKQADSGFWYRIDYAGDTPLVEGASVDVVVKEMLTDGTVIQDMEASGATLSQPVAAFPPVFKEAITKLHNHGSMTLVVPPQLAYGDKGYPPNVPPNATMVYTLRIAEMFPDSKKLADKP